MCHVLEAAVDIYKGKKYQIRETWSVQNRAHLEKERIFYKYPSLYFNKYVIELQHHTNNYDVVKIKVKSVTDHQ